MASVVVMVVVRATLRGAVGDNVPARCRVWRAAARRHLPIVCRVAGQPRQHLPVGVRAARRSSTLSNDRPRARTRAHW